jgi:hypothetical protein
MMQYHITPEDRALAATFGNPVPDYDGIAEVYVDSFEDWLEVFKDMEFVTAILGKFPKTMMLKTVAGELTIV